MNKENEILNLSVKKILIIRLSSLGDILLTTPFIRSLKNKHQSVQLDFILKKHYQDALKFNPHITNLFLYDTPKENISILISELKKEKYDLIIDLQNNFRSAEIVKSLKIKTLKFNKRSFDKFLLVNFKINRLQDAPSIPERYSLTIPDFKLDDEGLELYTKNNSSDLLNGKEKIIGFVPGSRHFTKKWPKEYYEKLGTFLTKSGYTIALLGGKDDLAICHEISEKIVGSINLCNQDDLLQTCADMKECKVIVCNDSGLMHAACAMNIPVLAFFGSTVKEFGFFPYKNSNLILENNSLSCRPCSHIGRETCPKGHFRCMLDILPEKAFKAINTLIENR